MAPEVLREINNERVSELLKVLANPIRLKVIDSLSQHRELNVGAIQERIGISQSLLTHHLTKMSDKSILTRVARGAENYYSLSDPILADWLTLVLKIQR